MGVANEVVCGVFDLFVIIKERKEREKADKRRKKKKKKEKKKMKKQQQRLENIFPQEEGEEMKSKGNEQSTKESVSQSNLIFSLSIFDK